MKFEVILRGKCIRHFLDLSHGENPALGIELRLIKSNRH